MTKLEEYKKKRDFSSSPEPEGSDSSEEKNIFVIQKHDASNLHYDFRLEIDGTLKSWAIPKGPSTDPGERRLAMPTEDHPIEYADFEGTIPEGQYGGGKVIVWDRGSYRNLREEKTEDDEDRADMAESYDQGKIEIYLEGEKLRGGYALIRTGNSEDDARWLLIKMDDDEADARRNPTSTEPESVISGKTIEDLKQDKDD